MSDDGARLLVADPAALARLERINVAASYLTEEGEAALRAVIPSVRGGDHRGIDPGDPTYRYVAVSE